MQLRTTITNFASFSGSAGKKRSLCLTLNLSIVLTTSVFSSSIANACIWDNAPQPYWPSNDIGICFVRPPGGLRSEILLDLVHYERAKQLLTQAVREQINARSRIRFHGFGFCDTSAASLPPMIRVKFTRATGRGSSGYGGLSGRAAASSPENIEVDYLTGRPGRNKEDLNAVIPSPPEYIKSVGLHEIFHLLGFQHDNLKEDPAELRRWPTWVVTAPRDPASITNWNSESDVLSAGDLSCLESLARRDIARPGVQAAGPNRN